MRKKTLPRPGPLRLFQAVASLREFGEIDPKERFRRYRRHLYQTGSVEKKGTRARAKIDETLADAKRENAFKISRGRRLSYRTRHFTDSGIIGTKEFVRSTYNRVQEKFWGKKRKSTQAHQRADPVFIP